MQHLVIPDTCGPARLKTGPGWRDAIENVPYRAFRSYATNAQSMFKTARRSPFLNAAGKLVTLHPHDEEM